MKDLSYEERLKKLKLTTLTFRRIQGDMIEVYKIFNLYDKDASPKLENIVADHNLRGNSSQLQKQACKKNVRLKSIIPTESCVSLALSSK